MTIEELIAELKRQISEKLCPKDCDACTFVICLQAELDTILETVKQNS